MKRDNEILDNHIKELEKQIHEPFKGCINPVAQTIFILKEMKDA